MSKVFEKVVLKQLVSFIDEAALLGPHISGFRKGHSTTTALLGIRDDIIRAMKRGEVSILVFADYSKAFDTIRFSTVIKKMHNLGFSRNFLLCLGNYLSYRQQFVGIDDVISSPEPVMFGIPQGSILGPVIFNLYVTDLQDHVQCKCFQYADDTTLYVHSKVSNLTSTISNMNRVIDRLESYSSDSNLSLNKNKTNWMLASTPQMDRIHSLYMPCVYKMYTADVYILYVCCIHFVYEILVRVVEL